MIQAVRLRAKQSDVILIHGFFMHACTEDIGFKRFFSCYSDKVSYIRIHPSTRYAGSLCKLQAFTHISNVVHTGPYSLVLTAMFNKILQPLLVTVNLKDVPQPKPGPEEGAADRRTARR